MRTIASGTLTLEPQVAAHAEPMFDVLSDPAIYQYENEPPASVAWLRERFRRLESRRSADGQEQWLNWVVRLNPSALIGYVQASVTGGYADIAYVFGSAFWGRGLAGQAVAAMLAELEHHYQVDTFCAVFKRDNCRSQRLLERLGFEIATVPPHAGIDVACDEALMCRRAGSDRTGPGT